MLNTILNIALWGVASIGFLALVVFVVVAALVLRFKSRATEREKLMEPAGDSHFRLARFLNN